MTTETITPTATGIWTADKIHSSIGFAVKHMVVATYRGEFEDFDASLEIGDGEPRLTGTVRVESVKTRDENLQAHLLSPDFFDAERNPELRFVTTRFEGRPGGDIEVTGDLTIKGTTLAVTGRGHLTEAVVDIGGNEKVGLSLEAVIDRAAFGLDWNAPLPSGGLAVSNDVKLIVELELVKAQV